MHNRKRIHCSVSQLTIQGAINSFPLYYAAKALFGTDKFKAFVKGVLGAQIAGLKREGVVASDTDFRFYGG